MRLSGRDLVCVRGGREVFADLSFAVSGGEALSLVGPNGAGKSSLLRVIAGLVHPVLGVLTLDGGDGERSVGEHCHYLGHLDALKPALTLRENVGFWRSYYGGSGAVEDALDAVSLGPIADLPAGFLSAGQKRRAALARLLVAHRPIWLLDEPTSALDAGSQDRLFAIVGQHLEQGGIVVAATHQALPFATDVLSLEPAT